MDKPEELLKKKINKAICLKQWDKKQPPSKYKTRLSSLSGSLLEQ